MTKTEIQPALDLLAARRATNGYATIEDLAAACGIDIAAQFSAAEVRELHDALMRTGRVASPRPIGTSSEREYRLLA